MAELKKSKRGQVEPFGLPDIEGGTGGGYSGGRNMPVVAPKQGEILPPTQKPIQSEAAKRLGVMHWHELDENGMSYSEKVQRASLGPMWPELEKRGFTYKQLMELHPKDAYKLMQARTIGGGGMSSKLGF